MRLSNLKMKIGLQWKIVMKFAVSLVGGLATTGFLFVSAWMNYRFGISLGRETLDGYVFGIASVCADAMKAILPFVIVAAWRQLRLIMLVTSIGLWTLCSAYSLTSSLGFAASNRADVTDGRKLHANKLIELRSSLERKRLQLGKLASPRDPMAVINDIEAHKQHRRWQSTKRCERATVSLSRRYCERYFALRAEHATAMRAQRLDQEITRLRRRLDNWKGLSGSSIDPQVSVIDRIVGMGEDRVTLAITVLLSLMLEVGSGLGFFLVLNRTKTQGYPVDPAVAQNLELLRAERPAADDADWLRQRLRSDQLASIPLWQAHQDYLRWCAEHRQRDTRTLTEFGNWLRDDVGLRMIEDKGQQQLVGICLTECLTPARIMRMP